MRPTVFPSITAAMGACVFLGTAIPSARADRSTFEGIGVLPGAAIPRSAARAVSADGSVVVGRSRTPAGFRSFRWTRANGIVSLGDTAVPPFDSEGLGISSDGSTIVGVGAGGAFRWTAANGMQLLSANAANACSSDGSVIVGDTGAEGFRFTALTGMVLLGSLRGAGGYSPAFDVSSDGLTIVGTSNLPGIDTGQLQAYLWTPQSLMVGLGYLNEGENQSTARAVSANGLVVVGDSGIGSATVSQHQAFRWTQQSGMVGLGYLPGSTQSYALGVSGNGSVVVGTTSGTNPIVRAFYWTQSAGMRDLRTVLTSDYGMDLTGWTLYSAEGISPDGSTIVGTGVDPCGTEMGWIARLGSSPQCRADFNSDGNVSIDDLFLYLNAWFTGNPHADMDGMNCVTIDDLFLFLNDWFTGCP